MNTTRLAALLCCMTTLALMACGSPARDIGAACSDDRDCTDRCIEDYPGGMCTLSCRDDRDCPPDAACADTKGGICLLLCDNDRDCEDQLEEDYECDNVRSRDDDGRVRVCRD